MSIGRPAAGSVSGTDGMSVSILFVTQDLADNSTGRAYALWTLARELDWDARVVAPSGDTLWAPLQGTEFEAACELLDPHESDHRPRLRELASAADLIVAVKPLPQSLGIAHDLHRISGTPLLLDIDDPDIEVRFPLAHPIKLLVKAFLRPRAFFVGWRMRRLALQLPVIVSNPVLQSTYGGAIIPHVRADTGQGAAHTSRAPSIVFVGTNRRHKGVGVLRAATARLAHHGFTLTVTDSAPNDAQPWERWIGATSFDEGLDVVRGGDIVVIPSMPGHTTSTAQLPAKLMDAMVAGRAVIVSDFAPLRWAVGNAGLVVKPGSVTDLSAALKALADPLTRRALGVSARARALELFTVSAAVDTFRAACTNAIFHSRQSTPEALAGGICD